MFAAPRSGALAAAATVLGLSGVLICPQLSSAGQWDITPSITVSETFSDNATLATENEDRNSDLITVIAPGVSVRGTGGRVNLNLDYSLQQRHHLLGSSADTLRNQLLGDGQVELWDRVLFVRGQASISRQIVDGALRSSNSLAGEEVNSATVRTFNLTPIFRHHFGNWVDTESSVTVSRTDTSDNAADDTLLITERIRVDSGRRFTVLLWSLELNNSKASTSDNQPSERRRNIDANFTYVYGSRLSLLAGVGWERVRSNDLDREPNGPTWNVGFDARPGPLTSFRMTVGERNEDRNINIQARHQFSPRTTVNATFSETLQTTVQQLSQDLRFIVVDPETGVLIDSRTGQPFVAGDRAFGLDNETFRQRRMTIGLSGSRRRNSFGADIFYEEREFEVQNRNEVSFGAGVRLGRQHTRRLSSSFTLNYRRLDPDQSPNQVENEGSVGASLSYRLSETAVASMGYNFTLRRINNSTDNLHENAVTVGLRKTF